MTTVNPDVALPAGIYRHYKGPLYLVLGLAHDANAESFWVGGTPFRVDLPGGPGVQTDFEPLVEREVVVYVGLQLDEAHEGARLAVRTLQDFFACVCPDSTCDRYGQNHDGHPVGHHEVPRFSYVGPRFDAGMLW